MSFSFLRVPVILLVGAAAILAAAANAGAQIPPPPATLTGSITDAAGPVPEGVLVEAFIDNTLCGSTETFYAGEGSSRVTIYVIDVFADGQVKGCGKDDAAIRLRVGGAGGRLAQRAVAWQAGLTRFDIVFGENVTPAPIPTTTPTPVPTPTATARPGTPGGQQASQTPTGNVPTETSEAATATGTPAGGLTGSTTDDAGRNGGSNGGGGFPVWGTVLLVVAGIAVIGAGAGLLMARAQRSAGGEAPPAP